MGAQGRGTLGRYLSRIRASATAGRRARARSRDPLRRIRTADLVRLAHERNGRSEHLIPDFGPAMPIQQLLYQPEAWGDATVGTPDRSG
jgi:hypothetical protein